MGACGHVLSCQTLNIAASCGFGSSGAYSVLKAPRHGYREPGYVLSRGVETLTDGKILSTHGF
jgi:hypothetical protein